MATTRKKAEEGAERFATDEESMAIIYKGANRAQLQRLFRLDNRTVNERIVQSGVKPVATGYKGADLYAINEIAPYLVKPAKPEDIENYIRRMNPMDLPPMLKKEFWTGQRQKQIVEEAEKQLWRTEKVVEEVGELLKLFKMSVLLMKDAVERQTMLTPRQRAIIDNLSTGMLNDLIQRIQERFRVPEKPTHVIPEETEIDDDI